jgi:ATP-binding cassette subfamily F protein 3
MSAAEEPFIRDTTPTNHLDLDVREALTLALQDYEGAMVLVSHDRHLLRATTDRLLLVSAGRLEEFDGDLDDYRDWLSQRRREQQQAAREAPTASRREQRRAEAEARQRLSAQRRPLERQIRDVEGEIERLSQEKQRLETLLAAPDIYADACRDQLKEALLAQSRVNARLQEVEERWLDLQGQLEAL